MGRALDVARDRPLVLAAHDWGGAVAMGWAVDHPERVAGMILCNTGIAVPEGRAAPGIIRLAASRPLRDLVCRRTPTFVEGTVRLSQGRLTALDREAFRAPYRGPATRGAIADFVGDIPLQPGHPTEAALADVAERLPSLTAPVLLAWGSADPVFDDDFAADLAARLPNTELHRFAGANHLVMAEADVAAVADTWLGDLLSQTRVTVVSDTTVTPPPLWSALLARRDDRSPAFVDLATGDEVTWAELARQVEAVAAELSRRGLRPGDRVAMLTPPGPAMVAAIFGVVRVGGVTVVADRGLGLRGLGAAVRGAGPTWAIGPRRALNAAAALRWAPRATRLEVGELLAAAPGDLPDPPGPDDPAAVLFTSGATGPAKGVRYSHRQLAAQRDALAATYRITSDDRLVAAFAPFALYGPALGIPTALPDCDVTTPGELTAQALDAACARVDATLAFASPAALANVVATAGDLARTRSGLAGLRVVFSAGAPVPAETLHAVATLTPDATLHTPYGMTEVLPVADIDLVAIDAATSDDPAGGVCVGHPVTGADVRIVPLDFEPTSIPEACPAGVTGEILVSAPWVSDGYAGLWHTERLARPPADRRWHRSGDVGHVDEHGRLWVEGRSVHVISTVEGPVTPVPVERAVERGLPVARAAAVGVGPAGCQQVVVVVEAPEGDDGLAPHDVAAEVRRLALVPVAAVLTAKALPVDIRHNSKIDRTAVARWAGELLAGRRARRLR